MRNEYSHLFDLVFGHFHVANWWKLFIELIANLNHGLSLPLVKITLQSWHVAFMMSYQASNNGRK